MSKKLNKRLILYFLVGNVKVGKLRDISKSPSFKPELDIRRGSDSLLYLTANYRLVGEKIGKTVFREEIVALIDKADESVQVMELSKLEKENLTIGKKVLEWAEKFGLKTSTVTQFRI